MRAQQEQGEKSQMEPTDRVIANPVAVLREEFDDWAILYNPDSAEAVGLNPTAVVVWRLIDGRRTVAEIIAATIEGFSQVPAAADEELRELLAGFLERGFVAVADAG